MKRELEEMEAQSIIKPATSEWAAPIVIVGKSVGTIRLCVDYRQLNTISRVDDYAMPWIKDLIDQLGQAEYISTLDLMKGYWQVPVAARDQPKTAFTAVFGLYIFIRIPFGYKVHWQLSTA